MGIQPKISGKTVERAYDEYRSGMYLVNRRYQRKLVWSTREKRSFIDSLKNGYPVPLFLFSEGLFKGESKHEIIDGMQRLNAIFGFIENEFTTDGGCYFDLSSTALTKELGDSGKIEQKKPVLDRTTCVNIASYELPYSTYEENDADIIDEVFRRINSNGKHLSKQEIRQAGATGEFAQIVRRLSIKLRGDVSHDDVLLLSQMKDISIQQDGANYGIKADDVFWVKENIINKEDLRQSLDEELVADLVGAMLSAVIPPSRVSVLDGYYNLHGNDMDGRGAKIEEAVQAIGSEVISDQFTYIIDEIKKIYFERSQTIIQHMLGQRLYRGPRYFQILFLSLYELLIKKEKKIQDYDALYKVLDKIADRTMPVSGGGGSWSSKEKVELVAQTSAVLEPFFTDRTEGDPMHYSYTTEVETLLRQSRTENAQYDFKQGVYDLADGTRNDSLLKKIFKTLTAMGNSEKNAVGYILIGVADKLEDAEKIARRYKITPRKVGNFYITGIDGETHAFYADNYDAYFSMFKDTLKKMPLNEYYQRQIGSKMRMVSYYDKSIIILKIVSDSGPVLFEDGYFTRTGANNDSVPVSAAAMPEFFAKFQ